MKKKLFQHILFGATAGLALWVVFTLLASYLRGDWVFPRVGAYLIAVYGNELNAVAAQCVCAMLCGMIWTSASLIFRETDWSLLKQTAVHCLVCMVPTLAIAWFTHMIPRGTDGPTQYVCLFGAVYLLNWLIQFSRMKKNVRQFNTKLLELKDS